MVRLCLKEGLSGGQETGADSGENLAAKVQFFQPGYDILGNMFASFINFIYNLWLWS